MLAGLSPSIQYHKVNSCSLSATTLRTGSSCIPLEQLVYCKCTSEGAGHARLSACRLLSPSTGVCGAVVPGHASGYNTSAMLWLLERVIIVFMHSCGDIADRILISGVVGCCTIVGCLTGHYVSPNSKLNDHVSALVGKGLMADCYNLLW